MSSFNWHGSDTGSSEHTNVETKPLSGWHSLTTPSSSPNLKVNPCHTAVIQLQSTKWGSVQKDGKNDWLKGLHQDS